MQIDHLCRVRECVNLDHLEIVSQAENVRRGRGTKLTVEDVRLIRRSDDPPKILAARFGVTASHVYQVRQGLVWADLSD